MIEISPGAKPHLFLTGLPEAGVGGRVPGQAWVSRPCCCDEASFSETGIQQAEGAERLLSHSAL